MIAHITTQFNGMILAMVALFLVWLVARALLKPSASSKLKLLSVLGSGTLRLLPPVYMTLVMQLQGALCVSMYPWKAQHDSWLPLIVQAMATGTLL